MTVVVLLRLRFKLTVHGREERLLLAEEANALALGTGDAPVLEGEAARALLEKTATGNLASSARDRVLAGARERVASLRDTTIADFARRRAAVLAEDHARIRAAGINGSARQRRSGVAGRRGRTFRAPAGGVLTMARRPRSAAPAFDSLAIEGGADRAGDALEDRRVRSRRPGRTRIIVSPRG